MQPDIIVLVADGPQNGSFEIAGIVDQRQTLIAVAGHDDLVERFHHTLVVPDMDFGTEPLDFGGSRRQFDS